jgi:adenine-specific DNA-methyltransferase
MKRRWIGIEFGQHAYTHCYERLKSICSGSDNSGITADVNWQGGGGFKFYELAPSLLNQDDYGNWIISKEYNPDMLAATMAKQENFSYNPDTSIYWKQGKSTEKDFIFTTTQFVSGEMLDKLHNELAEDETLLICATSFAKGLESRYINIKLRKIPLMLLGRCEFDKDNYNLNIINLPAVEDDTNEDNIDDYSDNNSKELF